MRIIPPVLLASLIFMNFAQANVFGGDDRVPLSAVTAARFPVGKLVSSTNSFCSATLIGPSEILTAAHCFLDPRTLEAKNPLPEFRIRDRDGIWHRASIKGFSSDRSVNPLVH
ncbi:MAG: trypsin-like serine protease, partial [Bdellovibrionaceae bacterium]|nr:trypsin-like serine protease [Pseudobdellovibrionaceae bacterium]